ncbi:disks large-associated protein 5-like isoform X2 [Homalodisca vitripennis]|uniref:disks large-associated protein 5-like isoform X2 n=1 Tax=Homalodisca vitripennis TaxID=197043 RepID=UPI001EECD366|nr:disks large-associated protein 5-like isoform X2 [Homalodisca vitripennis]
MDNRAYLNMYKIRPSRFGNVGVKRQEGQRQKLNLDRHARRTKNFNANRNILNEGSSVTEDPVEKKQPDQERVDRKQALLKFKAEKEAIKKLLKEKARPPFKVGIPHHGSSPVLKDLSNIKTKNKKQPTNLPVKSQPEMRMTRARGKVCQGSSQNPMKVFHKSPVRMFPFNDRKTLFNFNLNKEVKSKRLTSPQTPVVLKRSAQKNIKSSRQVLPPKVAKPKVKAKPSTSSTDSELAVPLPTPSEVEEEVIRDLRNQMLIIEETSLNAAEATRTENSKVDEIAEISTKKEPNFSETTDDREKFVSTPKQQQPIQELESSAVVDFQRSRLADETNRLLELADKWQLTALHQNLPRDVGDEIDSLVGQTRLLTKDKFNQFKGLIDEFESNSCTQRLTTEDLNGFWDMMYLQVEALIKRYSNLDILKENNWIKPEQVMKKKRGVVKKSQPKTTVSSSIREAIRARRTKLASSPAAVSEKSPVNERKSVMANVLSNKKRTRSNSPSPYIAIYLSRIGRSLSQTPKKSIKSDDLDGTPNILTKKIKIEHEYNSRESDLSTNVMSTEEDASGDCNTNGTEISKIKSVLSKKRQLPSEFSSPYTSEISQSLEQTPQKLIGTEDLITTPKSTLREQNKIKDEHSTRKLVLFTSEEEEDHEVSGEKSSLRRSVRLMSQTPASNKKRQCPSCLGTPSQRPRMSCRVTPNKKIVCPSCKSPFSYCACEKYESKAAAVPSTSRSRFMLKPSTLNVPTNITNLRGAVVVESEANTESVQLRRSSRKPSSARKVTFIANNDDKPSMKVPATPYRKSSRGKVSVEVEDSD